MFENEQDFRKLVGRMKIDAEPDSAHRERLRRQMLATFEQTGACSVPGKAYEEPPYRVSTNRLPFSRLAIAATVLVAATAAVWMWFGPAGEPTGFDRVRLATESAPWLLAARTRYAGGEVQTERHWYNFAARETYVLMEDGAVVAHDYGSKQMELTYNPRLRTVVVSELPRAGLFGTESAYNFVQSFAVFAARNDVTVEELTDEYEGRAVWVYDVEATDLDLAIDGRTVAGLRMRVSADPETRRIVAASVEHQGRAGNMLAREEWVMSYPASGPASIYDVGVPSTARVVDLRHGYRGTPGDVSAALTPAPSPATGFRLEPLRIELPRPRFAGTPKDARTPNLERPRRGPRPPFLVPAGTVNAARGKPVSSSDPEPIAGSLDMITDGDKEAVEGNFVELGPGPQHITIDLLESHEIYAVVIWHYHRWPRVYHNVVVQISDDPTFRTGVRTIFNNDIDNSLGLGAGRDLHYTETYEGKLIDGRSTRGRYVRCYSNGNTHDELNHYIEVEVYGRPVRSIQSD